MEVFKNTVTHLSKLTASSIICSVVFLVLTERVNLATQPIAHFLLLCASLIFFQGLHVFFCRSLASYCSKASDYFISALSAYGVYLVCAVALYALRLSGIYNYLFLPTRFLEPVTVSQTFSMTVAHIVSVAVIFLTYLFHTRERRESDRYRGYGDY